MLNARLNALIAALILSAAPALAQTTTINPGLPAVVAATSGQAKPTAEESTLFVEALTADATAALTDEALSDEEKLEQFRGVLADGLALDVIGKFMLGDKRKAMSEAQIARYDAVFPGYITKLYAEQFDEIVGRPLEVLESRAVGARDRVVRTQFTRASGSPIKVDWRVRKLRTGELKMIDIIVSGVSIMLVKREEFSAFITQNGIDALLDRLEEEAGA